jgi:hypothetical protein
MFVAKNGQCLNKTNLEVSLKLGGEVDFATLLRRHLLLVDHVGAVLRTGRGSWNIPVLRIRIHRIHMFLGLLDPDPDQLIRGMDPDPDPALDPDPSIIKQI